MKRLADKPFALLGVNSDQDRQALKTVVEEEKITWRSWWDGPDIDGPIATRWQVGDAWPTIYVLDADGIIRHVDTGGAALDMKSVENVVETLLKNMESQSTK